MGICETLLLAASPDLIYVGILALLFIAVVVFCIVARKTWGWIDITFSILSFLAGIAAIWGATQCYSLRKDDLNAVEKHQVALETATAENNKIRFGEARSITYDPGSLRAVSGELSRELTGRGRVWSNGKVAADGDNRVFTFTEPRPDVALRPLVNVVVFAFLTESIGGKNYPAQYIGSARVKSEPDTGESVTLAPVALAEPDEFDNPSGQWTLFEKMPLDRRGSFKQAAVALLKDNSKNSPKLEKLLEDFEEKSEDFDISLFRDLLTNRYLPADLIGLDADSREYEELIDMYAFDGISLGKIQNWIDQNSAGRKTLQFEPPPEEVFYRYKFDKKSSKAYQVDSNGEVKVDGLFNQLGLAIDKGLHAGKEIEFKKDDKVLVDQKTADGYQRDDFTVPPFKDNEAVTLEDRIFIRQVRDFPYEFADLREQTQRMAIEAEKVKRNNAIQEKALADSRAQQRARDTLTANLEEDKAALERDLETINRLYNVKSQENDGLKQKIAALESRIRDSYLQLRSLTLDQARRAFAGN